MIYITGDTHGDFRRFSVKNFPGQRDMTRRDFVIVLGDFGGVWAQRESKEEKYNLDWLNDKPFTLCFVDGNHENYDRLSGGEFPAVPFCGGAAHQIRQNVYHLIRGHVFDFDGRKCFVMGGAASHDVGDGILDPADFADAAAFKETCKKWRRAGKMFRVNHQSWWRQEIPSADEMADARAALAQHDYAVDYVLTHCLPQSVSAALGVDDVNPLTAFFDALLRERLAFREWHCGHYHVTRDVHDKYHVHYEDVQRIF